METIRLYQGTEEVAPLRLCDWCGEPFDLTEQPVPGYAGHPTHKRCKFEARKAFIYDSCGAEIESRWDREPFTDWPNGQGTYD